MKLYTLEEMTDKLIGKIGSPQQDLFETEVENGIRASIDEVKAHLEGKKSLP